MAGITSRCGCGATIATGSPNTTIPIGGATIGDFGAEVFIMDDPAAGLMNGLAKIK